MADNLQTLGVQVPDSERGEPAEEDRQAEGRADLQGGSCQEQDAGQKAAPERITPQAVPARPAEGKAILMLFNDDG